MHAVVLLRVIIPTTSVEDDGSNEYSENKIDKVNAIEIELEKTRMTLQEFVQTKTEDRHGQRLSLT